MATYRFFGFLFATRRIDRYFDCGFGLNYLAILATLCLVAPQVALSQEMENAVVTSTPAEAGIVMTKKPPEKRPVESELAITTMIPDGDYRMFSATNRCNAWTVGWSTTVTAGGTC